MLTIFKNEPKQNVFAPEWNYFIYEDNIKNLNFKSLKSSDASVVITSLDNEIDFTTAASALTSVGLIMPSAFTVTNTPITTTGSLTVVG